VLAAGIPIVGKHDQCNKYGEENLEQIVILSVFAVAWPSSYLALFFFSPFSLLLVMLKAMA